MALNNVPLAGQTLTSSRSPINANFVTISTAFAIDHVDYNTSGQGKHNKITFPSQSSAPSFSNPEIGLYNKLPAAPFPLTTRNELFIRRADGGETPITAAGVDGGGFLASSGYYYLPSGFLIKWGVAVFPTLAPHTFAAGIITLPVATNIPVFASLYFSQFTVGNDTAGQLPGQIIASLDTANSSLTQLAITLYNTGSIASGSFRVYYTALGL
jgi:hypothetical protein